jgi:hypothetical protein
MFVLGSGIIVVSLDIYGFLTYSLCFYLDVVSAFGAQTKEEINAELILLVFLLRGINATSYSIPVSLYLPAQI